jgi:hypothetical protein
MSRAERLAMLVKSVEKTREGTLQLVRRAGNGLGHRRGLASHRSRPSPLEARFHHAPLVVLTALVTVFIAQMNFHSGDVRAVVAQRSSDPCIDLGHEVLASLYVLVRVDLNLHHCCSLSSWCWSRRSRNVLARRTFRQHC